MDNLRLTFVRAAGGILTRPSDDGAEVVLVHRPRYDDWSLPKGKLVRGERWQDAALREVEEETQCRVRIGEFAGPILYRTGGSLKLTLFWRMECVESRPFTPTLEIDAIRWLLLDEAMGQLNYVEERKLLRQVLGVD